MRRYLALVALLATGCIPYAAIEKQLRRESAVMVGCPEGQVVISEYHTGMAGGTPSVWTASGCDRVWNCSLWVPGAMSGGPSRQECKETAESEAQTVERVVRDRLSLETGCPADGIVLERQAEWRRGTETAYRLTACGKAFVCTTAAGRTDCKTALSQ